MSRCINCEIRDEYGDALFIGGELDGQWLPVRNGNTGFLWHENGESVMYAKIQSDSRAVGCVYIHPDTTPAEAWRRAEVQVAMSGRNNT